MFNEPLPRRTNHSTEMNCTSIALRCVCGCSEECSTADVQSQPRLLKTWLAGKNTPLGHGGGTCHPALSKTTPPPPRPADPPRNVMRNSWKEPGASQSNAYFGADLGLAFRPCASPRNPQWPSLRFPCEYAGITGGQPAGPSAGRAYRPDAREGAWEPQRAMHSLWRPPGSPSGSASHHGARRGLPGESGLDTPGRLSPAGLPGRSARQVRDS
jgi:hypothetical protein